jgi:hypothetical protein
MSVLALVVHGLLDHKLKSLMLLIHIHLASTPAVLTLQEVHSAIDLHIVGTFEDNCVLSDPKLEGRRSLSPSYELYTASFPATIFAAEVKLPNQRIPKNVQQALSLQFVEEWGTAIDRENVDFPNHDCFDPVQLPPNAHILPCLWVFTRKRDNTAKARFCVGGHLQLLGRLFT